MSSILRSFSTNNNDNNNGKPTWNANNFWNLSQENDEKFDPLFTQEDSRNLSGVTDSDSGFAPGESQVENDWSKGKDNEEDVFKGIEKELGKNDWGTDEWPTAEGYKPWSFREDVKDDMFNIGEAAPTAVAADVQANVKVEDPEEKKRLEREEKERLEREEQELAAVIKGSYFKLYVFVYLCFLYFGSYMTSY